MNVMHYFLLLAVFNSQRVIQQEHFYGASRVYNNRQKNNVLSVGDGKKSIKNSSVCVTERVKYLKIFRCGR